jgi:hypothetical protein
LLHADALDLVEMRGRLSIARVSSHWIDHEDLALTAV